jgi:hypothetical protein
MSRFLLASVFTVGLWFGWKAPRRRIVAMLLIAMLVVSMMFPAPSYAQFGLLGGIQNILNIISGAIHSALNAIGAISSAIDAWHQQFVWPIQLINQARATVASLIAQFRGVLASIYTAPVVSATLPAPVTLEAIIRNRQTNDFPNLTQAYYQTFGAFPTADEADPMTRNMIDIDDGLALDSLKTLKTMDQADDLILESGDQIEDEARAAAPGSTPFLTASAMAANIQSQAMMQKMLAAMLRQEAGRIAHENALRKRQGMLSAKIRQGISDALRRP